jgi:uncharacterized membrane protein YgdD (TMEM256/DUF423 family)
MSIFVVLAGLMGAAGVALTAAAAHGSSVIRLDAAGYLLLLHASAVLAGIALLERALVSRTVGLVALAGFVLGSALFAGDLSLRAFAGHRLFPMAAPIGGSILIAAWIALAICGAISLLRR